MSQTDTILNPIKTNFIKLVQSLKLDNSDSLARSDFNLVTTTLKTDYPYQIQVEPQKLPNFI